MKSTFQLFAIALTSIVCGCASLDPNPDWDRAAQHVGSAVGDSQIYRPDDEGLIRQRTDELLEDGLSLREAIQACLLNNPRLQADLLKIGVARADFVQSQLLSNPSFSFAPRWPDGGGLSNLQFGLAQNVAELWQISFRERAAQRDLDRTILEAAREASLTARQAVLAYYRVLHSERSASVIEQNAELVNRLVDLTTSRREAGAGSDMDIDLARAQRAGQTLRARQFGLDVVEARAELVRLLGLQIVPESLRLNDTLPVPEAFVLSPEHLIATARDGRLDLKASLMAVDAAAARVAYERSRILKGLEIGVSAERNAQWSKNRGGGLALEGSAEITSQGLDPSASLVPQERSSQGSEWVVGPSVAIDLPIFDQNQAQIAKARFIQLQATKLVQAIETDVFQAAHVACARLKTAAENAKLYAEEIIPLRERVLSLSEDAYRAGRTSFLAVVQSQQFLQEARAGYIDALGDYAAAIVEIERVAGCPHERVFRQAPDAQPRPAQATNSETGMPASMPVEISP